MNSFVDDPIGKEVYIVYVVDGSFPFGMESIENVPLGNWEVRSMARYLSRFIKAARFLSSCLDTESIAGISKSNTRSQDGCWGVGVSISLSFKECYILFF